MSRLYDVQVRVYDIVLDEVDKARALVSKRYGDKPNRAATVALDAIEAGLKMKLGPYALVWREFDEEVR